METKEIARTLGIKEKEIEMVLGGEEVIFKLTTPAEAKELYQSCPGSMEPAVVAKWRELVKESLLKLTTPAEAEELYWSCPGSMDPAVEAKWEELAKESLSKLTTPAEAEKLYRSCPDSMKPAVIKAMAKL